MNYNKIFLRKLQFSEMSSKEVFVKPTFLGGMCHKPDTSINIQFVHNCLIIVDMI